MADQDREHEDGNELLDEVEHEGTSDGTSGTTQDPVEDVSKWSPRHRRVLDAFRGRVASEYQEKIRELEMRNRILEELAAKGQPAAPVHTATSAAGGDVVATVIASMMQTQSAIMAKLLETSLAPKPEPARAPAGGDLLTTVRVLRELGLVGGGGPSAPDDLVGWYERLQKTELLPDLLSLMLAAKGELDAETVGELRERHRKQAAAEGEAPKG